MKKSTPEWIWYVVGTIALILLFIIFIRTPSIPPSGPVKSSTAYIPSDIYQSQAQAIVIEFVDYQCPFCAQSKDIMSQLQKRFEGQNIEFQTRHYPLATVHPNSVDAAIAFECAKSSAAQESMATWMFENQNNLDQPSLTQQLTELQVLQPQNCFTNESIKQIIASDLAIGNMLKVQGTPTFAIINPQNTSSFQVFEGGRQVTELANAIIEVIRT